MARMEKSLTQIELAEKVGICLRQLQNIENKNGNPKYKVLKELLRVLNIPADTVFYPEKNKDNLKLQYIIHRLEQCTDSNLITVTTIIEAVLNALPSQ